MCVFICILNKYKTRNLKKKVFGYTHTVEQLLFSIVPSILSFDFDLTLGSIFKRRLVAFKGGFVGRFVGPSVCPQTVLKQRFCESNRYETS